MNRLIFLLCVVASCFGFTCATNLTTVLPLFYNSGGKALLKTTTQYTGNEISLTPSNPVLTLDYGIEIFGTPVLKISSISGPVIIELKYSEGFSGLENRFGDGPLSYTNTISNTFRTETFDITKTGDLRSYFLQGGLRWQSIRLVSGGTVGFSMIGMETNVPILSQHPGLFKSSNWMYSKIWELGANAVQLTCVEKGTLRSTWDVTEDGALIHGQQSAQSVKGLDWSNYTLTFTTKIVSGGIGWRVATPVAPYGPMFYLTANYSSDSIFAKTIPDMLPPNSLVHGYGWGLVNVSTLTSGPFQTYPGLPAGFSMVENEWYEITTTIAPEGYVIAVNQSKIATISYAEGIAFPNAESGPESVTKGSWSFGPYQDQVAYVKDVKVEAANGSILYENDMRSTDILVEYGVASNQGTYCLDGPRRDRMVWIGDFTHTARVLGASTNGMEFIKGTLDFEFAMQLTSGAGTGLVPTKAPMGVSPINKEAYYPQHYPIIGYQILFMITIGDYYQMTGDLPTSKKYWEQTKLLASAMLSLIHPTTGLMAADNAFFVGPSNGSAPSAMMALALRKLVPVALGVGDKTTAAQYSLAADKLAENINKKLWNEKQGFYAIGLDSLSDFSAAGTAFTILSGVANADQASRLIAALPQLKYGVGYVSDTTIERNNVTQLSPNIYGFVLEALFKANATLGVETLEVAKDLLDNFWSKMVTQNEYFTGASWEYLYPDGSPGMGLFTSLGHPWGGAPTYLLPEYVLGITALEPGYKKWQFRPLVYGLNLDYAEGAIPTPSGKIEANWNLTDGVFSLNVNSPVGTTGSLQLPFVPARIVVGGLESVGSSRIIEIKGGEKFSLVASS